MHPLAAVVTTRYVAREHASYDVYVGPKMVGSVWSYGRHGWLAFTRSYWFRGGFFATREQAAAALDGSDHE